MEGKTNPITPAGYAAMKARYDHLLGKERPEIVEIVSWAAGNGDPQNVPSIHDALAASCASIEMKTSTSSDT